MIDRETFERMKQRHGGYGSWAVWANASGSPKSNMGDLRVLDPDWNPTLLQTLRNDVVMVGLNLSDWDPNAPPFRNFHGPLGGAFKIRYVFAGTPFYGAYMTDFIRGVVLGQSQSLLRYLKENPSVVAQNTERFLAELEDLGAVRPTILAFGNDAHRLIKKSVPGSRYSRLVGLRHYSDWKNKEDYRRECLVRLAQRY